jgi:hypothetical protein
MHNTLVKQGKHPPFLVNVVCLTIEHINQLREYVYKHNPKLNLFRFTLFEYVCPDDPDLILKEKLWSDAITDPPQPLSFFE